MHSYERKYSVVDNSNGVSYVETLAEVREIGEKHGIKHVFEGYADVIPREGGTEYRRRNTRRVEEPDWRYKHRGAREAFMVAGKEYADYIEQHTDELVGKGYDVADRSLGEALAGNDGD